jgi:teichuronic acid biosynthesis glycosyltransferase TuaG
VKLFKAKKIKKEPKVSIILPNYNSSKTIVATINSILQQTYKNCELIIVDDCSDVKTKNILSKYKKIKIFYLKKNKGAAFCRNLAIKKSKSDYIAFIDSDDLWAKNKLKLQINFMQKNNYLFTYTNYKTFKIDKPIKSTIQVPAKFNLNSFIKNTSIATSTMIVKRSITSKIKFSNTKICEDYFYKCQLLKKIGSAYCYPGYLTEYQIRKNSLQSNRIRNLYWIWRINKKLNHFNIFKNLISIFFISLHSIKKYGFR